MTPEEARTQLELVGKIKAHPDYNKLTTEEMQILQDRENEYRAVATGQAERLKKGELPMPQQASALELAGESAKGVGRQVLATGAALLQSVPFYVPAMEAAGDLAQELTRGYPTAQAVAGAILPRSGSTEAIIQNAPFPAAARAFGALSPMASATKGLNLAGGLITKGYQAVMPQFAQRAAATTGEALNLAQTPATVAYQAIQKQAAKLPLVGPATSHGIAGAATGAATGAVDAGLRRVAPAALGQEVPPLDVTREIFVPGAAGAVGAAIPGVHNAMTRKGFQPTAGSRTANKFIEVKRSGRENDPNDPLYGTATGEEGVTDVAKKGKALISEADARGKTAISEADARGKAAIERAQIAGRESVDAVAAAQKRRAELAQAEAVEQMDLQKAAGKAVVDDTENTRRGIESKAEEAWRRRVEARKAEGKAAVEAAESERTKSIAGVAEKTEQEIRQHLTAQDKDARDTFARRIAAIEKDPVPATDRSGRSLFQKMDEIISTKAKSSTAGTKNEELLPYGEHLRELWGKVKKFISNGTVRDYRNALAELAPIAERGAPGQAWVAQELHKGIKEHLKDSHAGVAAAYDEYASSQHKTGRGFNTVYGEESPRDIGMRSPDPDDPYIDILPTQEVQARKRVTKIGDTTPDAEAWRPAFEELGGLGLKPQVEAMRGARTTGDETVSAAAKKSQAGVAELSERVARSKANIEKKTREKTKWARLNAEAEQASIAKAAENRRAELQAEAELQMSQAKREAEGRTGQAKREAEKNVATATERAEQEKLLAEEMGTEAVEAKHAVEMSRFPGITDVLSPVAQGIAAMTGHSPSHSAAVAGMAGATFLRRLKQFGQSNLALGLDPLAQPGLPVGIASQAAAAQEIKKARERITGKGLVEKARAMGAKAKSKYNQLTSE